LIPLWTSDEIARATGGTASEPFAVTGVSFDSREAEAGHLFVAMKGETMDGHRFVPGAFASGAAAALVSQAVDGPHVMVPDAGAALNAMAVAARARTSARIVGVTGSVGKTGTKEALFAALDRHAPGRAHRSVKSYNNHTGVPLSLARMPANTAFGVFEMGMNHAGELAELTQLVRPHAAIVTAIAPAHREFFDSEEAIADAKGEIFQGLQPGGTAIIPFDSPHRDRLRAAAEPYAARILTFGRSEGADVHAREAMATGGGTLVCAVLPDAELTFTLAPPGDHWVSNAMAVLAAVYAVGGDLPAAGLALAEMPGLPGRGERVTIRVEGGEATLIDESYNANPASMAATLASLGREPGRRVAILGEMRELGAESASYHADLAPILRENGVETLFLVGPAMLSLASELPFAQHFPTVEALIPHVRPAPRDTILVKGSNGVGLARLVAALKAA
jgi:UDP-N-acetylmuramoyl-tripeptide--D-alanyl-D-alanine ligase